MDKKIDPLDAFRLVQGGLWDTERFMEWYQSVRTQAYSQGYKEASENAYRNGSGGEF